MKEVYLDNAATMIKIPEAIQAEADFYKQINANPLRGLYKKSVQAETEVEACRKAVLRLLNAPNSYTVVFSRGTTEAINIVAAGIVKRSQDKFGVLSSEQAKILVDIESHHSNILPWNAYFKNVKVSKDIEKEGLSEASLVSLTGASNVTGEIFTARIKKLRKKAPGAIFGVDAAQLVCHGPLDLSRTRVDFIAFSGHKIGAPMGIGCLVIKKKLLERLRPLNFGGEMVDSVEDPKNPVLAEIPARFEAGTLPVGGIYGLKRALDFWESVDLASENVQIAKMCLETARKLEKIPGVKVLAANGAILSFQVEGIHPHDVAQFLADHDVSVRAGYLCAEPYLRFKGWGPVVRASFSIFNTKEDASRFVEAVSELCKIMRENFDV